MSIESKNFVATAADIEALTAENLNAVSAIDETRVTYLRALVGTTQAELKGTKDITEGMQLKSLAIVHARFYAAVLSAVTTPDIADVARLRPEEKTRRALERNRRSNFARSANSTLRSWLKSGGRDIMSLNPAKTTKSQLIAETPPRGGAARKPTPAVVRGRSETLVERLLESTRQLANVDPAQARAILDESLQKIARELFQGAGLSPTTDAAVAAKEHRPLRAGNSVFWPTDTQVLRRQRMKLAA